MFIPVVLSGTGRRFNIRKFYIFLALINTSPNKNSQGNILPPQEPPRFLLNKSRGTPFDTDNA
jgi:hypothetical protein